MKKIILILSICSMLTACDVQETEPIIPKAEAAQTTVTEITSGTVTITAAATTKISTTSAAAITSTAPNTETSAKKKKAETTAVKKTEAYTGTLYEVIEETEKYEPVEVQHEAEPEVQKSPEPADEAPKTEMTETSGISQSEINGYIISSAAAYGMAGVSVLSGADMWCGSYSFNSPINTEINDSAELIESYADSELSRIYSECADNGMTPEEISQYLYIYVCWDNGWLYIMW